MLLVEWVPSGIKQSLQDLVTELLLVLQMTKAEALSTSDFYLKCFNIWI